MLTFSHIATRLFVHPFLLPTSITTTVTTFVTPTTLLPIKVIWPASDRLTDVRAFIRGVCALGETVTNVVESDATVQIGTMNLVRGLT